MTLSEIWVQLRKLQVLTHKIASEKGWHDTDVPFAQSVANIHGEISEAWEWYREGNPQSDHIPSHSGIEEEFADTILRILDTAEEEGLDVIGAVEAKCEYNARRPYRHGGKLA